MCCDITTAMFANKSDFGVVLSKTKDKKHYLSK